MRTPLFKNVSLLSPFRLTARPEYLSEMNSSSQNIINVFPDELHVNSSAGTRHAIRPQNSDVLTLSIFPARSCMETVRRKRFLTRCQVSPRNLWGVLRPAQWAAAPLPRGPACDPRPQRCAAAHYFRFSNFSTSEHHQLCTRITGARQGSVT